MLKQNNSHEQLSATTFMFTREMQLKKKEPPQAKYIKCFFLIRAKTNTTHPVMTLAIPVALLRLLFWSPRLLTHQTDNLVS